jgi:hypothetical protein
MDEIYIEPLLDVYEWEKMDPNERRQQEQLIELERFLLLEELALHQDDLEQPQQIESVEVLQEEEQQERNQEQLTQMGQWEQIAFLIQQLNEN